MKSFKFLILLLFLSCYSFGQNNTTYDSGWVKIFSSEIGEIQYKIIINDNSISSGDYKSSIYFRTNIPYQVIFEMYADEIQNWYDIENSKVRYKKDNSVNPAYTFIAKGGFDKENGWRTSKQWKSTITYYKFPYLNYLNINNQDIIKNGIIISTKIKLDETNNSNSQNSTGSSGTSSMNRGGNVVTGSSTNTNSEGTGWNGNNGSSNNNYNQQIQNQNTKTTEAFDLYNSTGNYEEAKRKLIEAKNNAPDEASRQVAQQNLDKLDKVEKRNQNVETISKTIDFTTDLIKTMHEEKKKAMFAEIEQIEKERMEKFEFYSNKLLVQLEKINVLEKNTKKTFDDYKILLNEFAELKKTYNELYYSVSMNDRDEYKKNQDYFKMKEEECQVRHNQALINMYKDGIYLGHNEIGNNINFSDYNLIKNIIEKLIINVDKDNGKSAYEIAYISNKTIDYLIGNYDYYNRTKPVNIDVINDLLNYLLENEYKYLEIANKNNISEAKFVKSYYLVTGWYKINQDINLARSNFKNLLDAKIINNNFSLSNSSITFNRNLIDMDFYLSPISKENVKVISNLFVESPGKTSIAKKIKQEFDKALLESGYKSIPEDNYNKNSSIFYKNIGDIYFDSNQISIYFTTLEGANIVKYFNLSFSMLNYDDIFKFYHNPTESVKIFKENSKVHNLFFQQITNHLKN